jgi:chromosome partitioning protein
MRIISIANQKGGVGKTTTAINLAAALKQKGLKILLVDSDPQASLTKSLGMADEPGINLYTEFSREMKGESGNLEEAIVTTKSGLPLIPSSIELAAAELELVSVYGREQVLSWMLERFTDQYDFIFIDCPPAMSMLTVNALVASDFVVLPLVAEFLPVKGVNSFLHHLKTIRKLNQKLETLGFIFTKFDERKIMARKISDVLEKEFGEKVFQIHIRNNIQLAKAQEAGLDIFSFDKSCHGAEDYLNLSEEFLKKITNFEKGKIRDQQLTSAG